jgi:hypothetical protein
VIWFDGGMRRLPPALLGLLLGLVLLGAPALTAAPASAAEACQPTTVSIPDAVAAADAVVTATATGPAAAATSAQPKRFRYPATVQQSFKGTATGAITVITQNKRCQLSALTPGATYLFFLAAHGTAWLVPGNLPSSADNLPAAIQQVQTTLTPPSVHFGTPMSGTPMSLRRAAAPGVALVIIGLLGLLVVRRLRRA